MVKEKISEKIDSVIAEMESLHKEIEVLQTGIAEVRNILATPQKEYETLKKEKEKKENELIELIEKVRQKEKEMQNANYDKEKELHKKTDELHQKEMKFQYLKELLCSLKFKEEIMTKEKLEAVLAKIDGQNVKDYFMRILENLPIEKREKLISDIYFAFSDDCPAGTNKDDLNTILKSCGKNSLITASGNISDIKKEIKNINLDFPKNNCLIILNCNENTTMDEVAEIHSCINDVLDDDTAVYSVNITDKNLADNLIDVTILITE